MRFGLGLLAVVCGMGAPIVSAAPLLHYSFDEAASGTTAALDTGDAPAAPGTFAGSAGRTTSTPGPGASVAALDSSLPSSYVNAGDVAKLDGLQQLTLSAWINLRGAPGNGNRIMAKQLGSGNFDGFSFAFSNPTTGTISASNVQLNLALGGSAFAFNTSGVNIDAADKWIFVAVAYDGTQTANNLKFFIGNELAGVTQLGTDKTANVGTLIANANDFRVAASSGGTVSAPIWIDDVRVYSTPLDATGLDAVRLANVPEPAGLGMVMALCAAAGYIRRRR